MSRFLVSREFIIPEITYNIGHIGDNIGRIGDTVATDSVVMEETSHKDSILSAVNNQRTTLGEEE